MSISKNWGKEQDQQAHKSDDAKTKRASRQKQARGFTRSNEGIARRAHLDTIERRERWGFTTLKDWISKRARKRRHSQQRKDRQRKHAMRIMRDVKYAKRCAKRLRDQARCYDGINISDRRFVYYAATEW